MSQACNLCTYSNVLLTCKRFAGCLTKSLDFNAKMVSWEMKDTLVEGADELLRKKEATTFLCIRAFGQSLPQNERVVILFSEF